MVECEIENRNIAIECRTPQIIIINSEWQYWIELVISNNWFRISNESFENRFETGRS